MRLNWPHAELIKWPACLVDELLEIMSAENAAFEAANPTE